MSARLEALWRERRAGAPFDEMPAIRGEHLVLGSGTILVRLDGTTPRLSRDQRARLSALLSVTGCADVADAIIQKIDAAVFDWWRGDRALAALRLAFLPLPRLGNRDDAYPLFLAEDALDHGVPPDDLIREFGGRTGPNTLTKFNPAEPRRPEHAPGAGQWTNETGSSDIRGMG